MKDRGTAASRGYGHKWRKAREGYLKSHPLCVECKKQRRLVAATVVDHIRPHKSDQRLFWDKENWQALCTTCHSSFKQRLERSGNYVGCDVDGWPLDAGHHWAKGVNDADK
jgi:5-methylcytosine-specific restriction endonuclease McrA